MQDDLSTFEFKVNDHFEHDGLMPNAYPPRKMFSSRPVSQSQYTEDKVNTDMRLIRKLAEYMKDRKFQNPSEL